MTDNVKNFLTLLNSRQYRNLRKNIAAPSYAEFVDSDSYIENFRRVIAKEEPLIFDYDDFGFNRSTSYVLRELSGNIAPNYYRIISTGFDTVIKEIKSSMKRHTDPEKLNFGNAMIECLSVALYFSEKYKDAAKKKGNIKLYNALCKVPHSAAESFYEACVFLKICIFFLRTAFTSHITLGRFDQYMYPFYEHDKKQGVTDEEIFETLQLFFISLNLDTDIYPGAQQGDNGQSMVLAGFDENGESMYNNLSKMCMEASLNLNLIDPKINLRVGKNTPDELYVYGTMLTKAGLGFPQYCNDDIVVPGLVKLGYDKKDALDYAVAACWEFIIPGLGADIPNARTMNFPKIVNDAVLKYLSSSDTFNAFMECVKSEMIAEINRLVEDVFGCSYAINPFLSIFMDGCIESLTNILHGGTKYNNFGFHGAGISTAADSLAAIKKIVFDEKSVDKETLLSALNSNFNGYNELRQLLLSCPKMGNNDDYVDSIASELMDIYAKNLNGRKNDRGGIIRAGTGSAQDYIYAGEQCPATADGRKSSEPYASSFSPSLTAQTNGLLSVLQSFTKYDLTNIINGGPLTIEIHDTVLKNDVGIEKTAMLVKEYINLGGHQLQLNSINKERLLDAQKNPEKYPNLIVRVWGWSGYFNELDLKFQNHIIRRTEYIS